MTKTKKKERSALITNLMDVSVDTGSGRLRTHTNALVLSDRGPDEKTGARYRVHGFRNEAGNPTFDMVVPSFEWTIEPQIYAFQQVPRHFALCFAGDPKLRIELFADFANDAPLDVERWDDDTSWGDVLLRKVLRYYHAPYIVLGQQFVAEKARAALGVESIDAVEGGA